MERINSSQVQQVRQEPANAQASNTLAHAIGSHRESATSLTLRDITQLQGRVDGLAPLAKEDVASAAGISADGGWVAAKITSSAASSNLESLPALELADLLSMSASGLKILELHYQALRLKEEIQALKQAHSPVNEIALKEAELRTLQQDLEKAQSDFARGLTSGMPRLLQESFKLAGELASNAAQVQQAAQFMGPVASAASAATSIASAKDSIQNIKKIRGQVEELRKQIATLKREDGNEVLIEALELKLYYLTHRKANVELVKLLKNTLGTGSGVAGVAGKSAVLLGAKAAIASTVGGPISMTLFAGASAVSATLVLDQTRAKIAAAIRKIPLKFKLFLIKRKAKKVHEVAMKAVKLHEGLKSGRTQKRLLKPSQKRLEVAQTALKTAERQETTAQALIGVSQTAKRMNQLQKARTTRRAAEGVFNRAKEEHEARVQKLRDVEKTVADSLPQFIADKGKEMAKLEEEGKAKVKEMEEIDAKAEKKTQALQVGASTKEMDEFRAVVDEVLQEPETQAAFAKHMKTTDYTAQFEKDPAGAVVDYTFA